MKHIEKAQGRMYDFFHLKQHSTFQIVKAHIQAYVNLVFVALLVMGILYITNYRVQINPMVKTISPIVEGK